jgi:hypothetical protein
MPVNGGAKRKIIKKQAKPKKSRMSKRKLNLPKTVKPVSRRVDYPVRESPQRAISSMSITDLQFMAKSRGIPFGGLTKTVLIRKINNYY